MDYDVFELFDNTAVNGLIENINGITDSLSDMGLEPEVVIPIVDAGVEVLTGVSPLDAIHTVVQANTVGLTVADNIAESIEQANVGGGWLDPLLRGIDDLYYFFGYGVDDVVTDHHFSDDGTMDLKNNVIVEGNVQHDMQFTEQQTHGSCSLMAQEQFVHRYTGQPIPEDYLEWKAENWGVYSPDFGTDANGQTMVLEHFHIPFERAFSQDIDDLNQAISENKDIIIGVDSRAFYESAEYPPGSGHAVAIVGRGLNPVSHEVEGFYVTDTNLPQTAHFVPVEKMRQCWFGDMISVPEKEIA